LAHFGIEIGAFLPLSRKSLCVRLNMLKLVSKTERAANSTFSKVLFCCLNGLWPEKESTSARRMRAHSLLL